MRVSFHGATCSVTGSRHLIEGLGLRLLLNCGLFQWRREDTVRRNHVMGFDLRSLRAVLLSHAPIDHSAILPVLPREGCSWKVGATSAAADLVDFMLDDLDRIE